jgi:magnesium transporter
MIHAFGVQEGRLQQIDADTAELLRTRSAVWLDLISASADELERVQKAYGVEFGPLEQGRNIETSARFYEGANGELHLRADFLNDNPQAPDAMPVKFVLGAETLISVHDAYVPTLRMLRERASTTACMVDDARDVLLEIYDSDAEYSADMLEEIHRQLNGASRIVLTRDMTDKIAAAVLARVAEQEALNGKLWHNISDTRRALSFLMRGRRLSADQAEAARQIRRDLDSLDAHMAFIFDKINFLMDATVGFVNIRQNDVIKIFSVAAVAMLPPTLIASIYGMNFRHMPELDWVFGYPFALVLMLVSVAVPLVWFRRRKWLK